MKKRDITGQRFGRLVAIKFYEQRRNSESYWLCKCDCGNYHVVSLGHLVGGKTISCGCAKGTHRLTNTPIYHTWSGMIQRCENNKNTNYYKYGARGIKVCEEWHKFKNFFADMGERPINKTLDRINNNKGYCKENCRWATVAEQAHNTRRNRFIIYNGNRLTITEWGRKTGIGYWTISWRIKQGWSIKDALTIKTKRGNKDVYKKEAN